MNTPDSRDYPVPKTNGMLIVRRLPNQWQSFFGGRKWKHAIIHVPTDYGIIAVLLKQDAVRIAQELYAKIPLKDWRTSDVDAINRLLFKRVKKWLLEEAKNTDNVF